ncbi:GNAT family N-acetyltransferase [Streptacidiphilus jiangxiensis]|uniref:GNAT family N-acetyltransferase n=1 Tax=Streptacidiphilus jiangxiensis TaxID=235985 RepID=UPI0009447E80|nr:GNAT family N-acetyltransferase [Streptacidiphilus jiangxiensis]
MIDRSLIERHAAQAWPAAEAVEQDGWLLRRTPGVSRRRSNSAVPYGTAVAPRASLARVEEFYAARDLPAVVQVAPAEDHVALDALLADRGYRRAAPTLVCTAVTDEVVITSCPAGPLEVGLAEHPARAWLDAFVDLDGHDGSRSVADRVLVHVPGPAAYLSATHEGRVVGIGLFVAAPGCAGVFCMATHPDHRRRGVATALLHVGARWAAARGAGTLYLQVEEDNGPARRLYEGLGFRVSHSYHYRIRSCLGCGCESPSICRLLSHSRLLVAVRGGGSLDSPRVAEPRGEHTDDRPKPRPGSRRRRRDRPAPGAGLRRSAHQGAPGRRGQGRRRDRLHPAPR